MNKCKQPKTVSEAEDHISYIGRHFDNSFKLSKAARKKKANGLLLTAQENPKASSIDSLT